MTKSMLGLSLVALSSQFVTAAVVSYDFDGGSSNGFAPGGAQTPITHNAYINNLHATLGIDGTTTVLTSDDHNIDPQLVHLAAITVPVGETWTTFEMRFRQLSLNPGQAGVAGSAFSSNGTLVIIGGKNTTGISTGSQVVGADTFVKTLTAEASGEWQVYTIDLAGTSIEGNDLGLRIDPVGNDGTKNFEVDYVRLTSVGVPEPSSALLTALASLGLLARRRK